MFIRIGTSLTLGELVYRVAIYCLTNIVFFCFRSDGRETKADCQEGNSDKHLNLIMAPMKYLTRNSYYIISMHLYQS